MKGVPNFFVLILTVCCSLFLASCERAELPVDMPAGSGIQSTQLEMGEDYRYQLFFDLESGSVVSLNLKQDWDLGFECGASGWHIILNSARGMAAAPTGSTEFTTLFDPGSADWQWDVQSGNLDSTAFVNWRESEQVYLIDRGYDVNGAHTGYRKLICESVNDTAYTIHYSALDGSAEQQLVVSKSDSLNFSCFSFEGDGRQIAIEPPKADWDLVFSQYTFMFPGLVPYLVTGVLLNTGGVSVAVDSLNDFSEIKSESIAGYSFSTDRDAIGYEWKFYDFDSETYLVFPEINFIIKTMEGHYFKMHFVDFYDENGSKGAPKFEFEQL